MVERINSKSSPRAFLFVVGLISYSLNATDVYRCNHIKRHVLKLCMILYYIFLLLFTGE